MRHFIKPGITGWAQVNGRNAISWNEKFELDIWYVKHKSFLLDLKILVLTFLKIVQTKDVNKKNTATTTKFKGNNL
jgi:lipopolysaccharide/colanic/teichoic acid biosynthesis glycosyltransferase